MINVKNLSKKYRRYSSVADGVKELLHPLRKKYHEEFWALKNVNFEIKKGESLGIVGRNGSGKSTLLQIICSILQPTEGKVNVNGRVSALLELGAGFHPQFTGRENVYLSAALMGFTKEETDEKFQNIVEFADIGDFIDQPVRTYSSGMFIRLAFATAINVDPDILIIDEALAVGDAEFQIKCLHKIKDFKKQGKNLVIVSHDILLINTLCNRLILLNHGSVEYDGLPTETIDSYFETIAQTSANKSNKQFWPKSKFANQKSKYIYFTDVGMYDAIGNEAQVFDVGQTIVIKTSVTADIKIDNPVFGAIIYSEDGVYLGGFNSLSSEVFMKSLEGSVEIEYQLIDEFFLKGKYFLSLAIHDETGKIVYDFHDRSFSFVVRGDAKSLSFSGHVKIPCVWKFRKLSSGRIDHDCSG
jgi:teichoic acid transport system ATP-binding protein